MYYWLIDWGDGTADVLPGTSEEAVHIFDEGERQHVIRAGVLGAHRFCDTDPLPVTVRDVPQVSIVNVPSPVPEGSVVELSSEVVSVDAPDGLTYGWLVMKGSAIYAGSASPMLSFSPDDNGDYEVALLVTDSDGDMGRASATVSATNVAPTPTISVLSTEPPPAADGTIDARAGEPMHLVSEVFDPGEADTFTYLWSVAPDTILFDEGTGTDGEELVFTPLQAGEYWVTLALADDDQGSNETTLSLNVHEAIGVDAGLGAVLDEGDVFTRTVVVENPSAEELNVAVGYGDGMGYDSFTTTGESFVLAHTYLDNGLFTVTVDVTGPGASGVEELQLDVRNVAPTVTIDGVPEAAWPWRPIELHSIVSDPGTMDTFEYLWRLVHSDGTVIDDGSSVVFTPESPGTLRVYLSVDDDDGATGTLDPAAEIQIHDGPVWIDTLQGDVAEGEPVTLGLQSRAGAVLADYSYEWEVSHEDYTVYGSGSSFTFTPEDDGTHAVCLVVTDPTGAHGGAAEWVLQTTVDAVNVAPELSGIGGLPSNPQEGDVIGLWPLVGDGGSADELAYDWIITKNGSTDSYVSGQDSTIEFVPDDQGEYAISLAVTDDDGATAATTVTLVVGNAAPSVTILDAPALVVEGDGVELSSLVKDPGSLDTCTLSWSVLKDGEAYTLAPSVDTTSETLAFAPADDGQYTITLTATDVDGASGSASVAIAVSNAVPEVALSGAAVVGMGVSYNVDLAVHDPGDDAVLEWTIDWGDGTVDSGTAADAWGPNIEQVGVDEWRAAHMFTAAGAYEITATATDEDGTSETGREVRVMIGVAITGPGAVEEGSPYTVCLTADGFTVSGLDSWTIDWGDGSVQETVALPVTEATHIYSDGPAVHNLRGAYTETDGTVHEVDVQLDFGSSDDTTTPAPAYSQGLDAESMTRIAAYGDQVLLLAPNPDGLAGGQILRRHNADGSIDTSFGDGGSVAVSLGGEHSYVRDLLVHDGMIILAGSVHSGGSAGYDFAAARYDATGSLDTTFGTDGVTIADFGYGDDFAYVGKVDSAGRIVLAGSASVENRGTDFAVARYSPSGSLDMTFGADLDGSGAPDGFTTVDFAMGSDHAYDLAVLADGRLVVAGTAQDTTGDRQAAMAALDVAGTLDLYFDEDPASAAAGVGDGKVVTAVAAGRATAYAIEETDGGIVMSGSAEPTGTLGDTAFFATRYNADGSLDCTFGPDGLGWSLVDFGPGRDDAYGLAVDSAGRLVLAGQSWNEENTNFDLALACLSTGGLLDTSFDEDGMTRVDWSGGDDFATDVLLGNTGPLLPDAFHGPEGYITELVSVTQDGKFSRGRLVVHNVVPDVSVGGPDEVDENSAATWTLQVGADPGDDRSDDALNPKALQWEIDWGDGQTSSGTVAAATGPITIAAQHTYEIADPNAAAEGYLVTARVTDEDGTFSARDARVLVRGVDPATPAGLRATAGDGAVALNWSEPAPDRADSYYLERWTEGQPRTEIWSGTLTEYTDSAGLEPGSTYYYAVSADPDGPWSNVVAVDLAFPPPPVPTDVTATPGDGTVTLTWAGTADTFEVWRSDHAAAVSGADEWHLIEEVASPGYVDGFVAVDQQGYLEPGAAFAYKVRAVENGRTSDYTAYVASGTVLDPPQDLVLEQWGAHYNGLAWRPVDHATSYEVYRDGESAPFMVTQGTLIGDPWLVEPDRTYTVVALHDELPELNSGHSVAVNRLDVAASAAQVTLAWEPPDVAIDGLTYHVYRDGEFLAALDGGSNSYHDAEFWADTWHEYMVRAVDGTGAKVFEELGTVLTWPPDPPEKLVAESELLYGGDATTAVRLNWRVKPGAEHTYRVYRRVTAPASEYQLLSGQVRLIGDGLAEYFDQDVQDQVNYEYVVSAYTAANTPDLNDFKLHASPEMESTVSDSVLVTAVETADVPRYPITGYPVSAGLVEGRQNGSISEDGAGVPLSASLSGSDILHSGAVFNYSQPTVLSFRFEANQVVNRMGHDLALITWESPAEAYVSTTTDFAAKDRGENAPLCGLENFLYTRYLHWFTHPEPPDTPEENWIFSSFFDLSDAGVPLGESVETVYVELPIDGPWSNITGHMVFGLVAVGGEDERLIDLDAGEGRFNPDVDQQLGEREITVPVNNGDSDGDGVPDFADGFIWEPGNNADQDLFGLLGSSSDVDDLAKLTLNLHPELRKNVDDAMVRWDYQGATGTHVELSGTGTAEDPFYFETPPDASLRLWALEETGSGEYRKAFIIEPDCPYHVTTLWPSVTGPGSLAPRIAVEGLRSSGTWNDLNIQVELQTGPNMPWRDADSLAVTVIGPDFRADSDNDGDFDGLDDQLEDRTAGTEIDVVKDVLRLGALLQLNTHDVDGDGIPDYADGYNCDGVDGGDPTQHSTDDLYQSLATGNVIDYGQMFTPLKLWLPDAVDLSVARLRIEYDASDPRRLQLDNVGTDGDPNYTYAPDEGTFRLWTVSANGGPLEKRSGLPFYLAEPGMEDMGFYVPPTPDGAFGPAQLSQLGFGAGQREVTLYVEAVARTEDRNNELKLWIDPDGPGPVGYMALDSLRMNDGSMSLRARIQDSFDGAYQILVVNDADKDEDQVPDFADQNVPGEQLTALELRPPAKLDPQDAKVRFNYSASTWDHVAGGPATGFFLTDGEDLGLRLYSTDDASVEKSTRFVQSETAYALSQFDPDGDGNYYAYVEAVRPSGLQGDFYINAEIDPDGQGNWQKEPYRLAFTAVAARAAGPGSGLVQTADGSVMLSETDLASDAFGLPWGVSRTWTNQSGVDANDAPGWQDLASEVGSLRGIADANGNGWQTVPYLMDTGSTVVIVHGGSPRYFDRLGSNEYRARFGSLAQLRQAEPGLFSLTEPDGVRWNFDAGRLVSVLDPRGNETTLTYRKDGKLYQVRREHEGSAECFHYSYYGSGEALGRRGKIAGVSWQRAQGDGNWTRLGHVQYTYYGVGEFHGNVGDLRTATVYEGTTTKVDTSHYRYHGSDGLKLVLGPDSYQRALHRILQAGWGSSPEDTHVTDAQLAPFADYRLEYDSEGRVAAQYVRGAGGTAANGNTSGKFTYGYNSSVPRAVGMNVAQSQTTVDLPGTASVAVVHTNFAGLPLLSSMEIRAETGETVAGPWHRISEYDTQGRLLLSAAPSAVSVSLGSAPTVSEQDGLVTHYSYYDLGDTADGAAPGRLRERSVSKGRLGPRIPQQSLQYVSREHGHPDPAAIHLVAAETLYNGEDGTGPVTTSTVYRFGAGDQYQAREITTTLPAIPDAQNGPGVSAVITEELDLFGRPVRSTDAEGYVETWSYSNAFGNFVEHVVDAEKRDLHPEDDPLRLKTVTVLDRFGRVQEVRQDAWSVEHTYVRSEDRFESRTLRRDGQTDVVLSNRRTGITTYETLNTAGQAVSRSMERTDNAGRTISSARLYSLSDEKSYATNYVYDNAGRLAETHAEVFVDDGTPHYQVAATVYDELGRVRQQKVGTKVGDQTPRLTLVQSNYYDGGSLADYYVVGDGNLTMTIAHPSGEESGSDNRVSRMFYDWRGRPVATKIGVGTDYATVAYTIYDNAGRPLEQYRFHGADWDGPDADSDGTPDKPSSGIQAKTTTDYDDLGRVFRTRTYSVTPQYDPAVPGVVIGSTLGSEYVQTDRWYNLNGNVLRQASAGKPVSEIGYDGAGRAVRAYTIANDDTGSIPYSAARSAAGDRVVEQIDTLYDREGRPLLVTTHQRPHASAATGPLTGSSSRVSYVANYYDQAGRPIKTVNFGTNGGQSPLGEGQTLPPAQNFTHHNFDGNDEYIVTQTTYDANGRVGMQTDARGVHTKYEYDALGRVKVKIDAYTNGTPSNWSDLKYEYEYDGLDHVTVKTQHLPEGEVRVNRYIYGVSTAATRGVSPDVEQNLESKLDSYDLLYKSLGPKDGTPDPDAAHPKLHAYNALGELTTSMSAVRKPATADPAADYYFDDMLKHTYVYDALGRRVSDAVDGSDFAGARPKRDDTVVTLTTSYDAFGRAARFASKGRGDDVVNEVVREYDGFGRLKREFQSHNGPVSPASTVVELDYAPASAGGRLASLTYPDLRETGTPRQLTFTYEGIDAALGRVTSIADSVVGGTVESYHYLGAGVVVGREIMEPGVALFFYDPFDRPGQCRYLDRFGRPTTHFWANDNPPSGIRRVFDLFQYAYDSGSNVLYKRAVMDESYSQLFHGPGASAQSAYDKLGRVRRMSYGVLEKTDPDGRFNVTPKAGRSGRTQSWIYDVDGNWLVHEMEGKRQFRLERRTIGAEEDATGSGGPEQELIDDDRQLDGWDRLVYEERLINTQEQGERWWEYDALGRRISEVQEGRGVDRQYANTFHHGPGGRVLSEIHNNDEQTGRMVYENVYSAAGPMLLQDRFDPDAAGPPERIYPLTDAQGNVTTLLTSQDGDWLPGKRFFYYTNGLWKPLHLNFAGAREWDGQWQYKWRGAYTRGARLAGTSGEGNVYHIGGGAYDANIGHTIPVPNLRDYWESSQFGSVAPAAANRGPFPETPDATGWQRWLADRPDWQLYGAGMAASVAGGALLGAVLMPAVPHLPYALPTLAKAIGTGSAVYGAGWGLQQGANYRFAHHGSGDVFGNLLQVGATGLKATGASIALGPAAGFLSGASTVGALTLGGLGAVGGSLWAWNFGSRLGSMGGWEFANELAGIAGCVGGGYLSRGWIKDAWAYGRYGWNGPARAMAHARFKALGDYEYGGPDPNLRQRLCFVGGTPVLMAVPDAAAATQQGPGSSWGIWSRRTFWESILIGVAVSSVALAQGGSQWLRRREEEELHAGRLSLISVSPARSTLRESGKAESVEYSSSHTD